MESFSHFSLMRRLLPAKREEIEKGRRVVNHVRPGPAILTFSYPASVMLSVWEIYGDFPIFAFAMEEVRFHDNPS